MPPHTHPVAISLTVLASACACASVLNPGAKPVIMVLGTYHMSNPGLDAVKVSRRDTLGELRQREVTDLISRLKKFRPTKILVERVPERQSELETQYAAYLAGAPATANEIQQIGFRLSRELGLGCPVGADHASGMDFERVFNFAEQNGMSQLPNKFMDLFSRIGKAMDEWDAKYSVSELLAIYNDAVIMRSDHEIYLSMLPIGKGDDRPGADLLSNWYRRNLVIYENIQAALQPGDRAIVIFGSGHAYLLNQLFADGGKVKLERASKYLPKPPKVEFPQLSSI